VCRQSVQLNFRRKKSLNIFVFCFCFFFFFNYPVYGVLIARRCAQRDRNKKEKKKIKTFFGRLQGAS